MVVARGANPELPSIAASLSSGSSSSNHQQKQQQQQQQLSPRQPSAPVQQLSPSLGSQSSRSSVGSGSVSASPRQPAITTTSSPSPLPATHHPVVEIISPDTASAAELLARSPSACSDSSKTGADMVVRARSPFSLFRVENRAYVQRQKKIAACVCTAAMRQKNSRCTCYLLGSPVKRQSHVGKTNWDRDEV